MGPGIINEVISSMVQSADHLFRTYLAGHQSIYIYIYISEARLGAELYSRDGLLAKYAFRIRKKPHQQSRTSVSLKLLCTTSLEISEDPHTGFQAPQESSLCEALKR